MKKGFTLIELLVVVFIIGILAALVIVNVSNSRKQARDGKRIANLKSIQTALEMYNDKTGGYPSTSSAWWGYSSGASNVCGTVYYNDNNWIPNLVNDGYLSTLPTDPKPTPNAVLANQRCYLYYSDGTDYKVKAPLETETDACQSQVSSIKEIADKCPTPSSWVSVYSSGGKNF